VAKLSNTLVQQSLLQESKDVRATYNTMKKPDTKSKTVGSHTLAPRKSKSIPQIEVPVSKKSKVKKSNGGKKSGGIPTADRADVITGRIKVASFGKSKTDKAKKSITVAKSSTPSVTPKRKVVKKPSKVADASSKSSFPSASDASTYTNKMAKGSSNLGAYKGKSTSNAKVAKAATLKATTRPTSKVVAKPKSKTSKKTSQVKKPAGGNKVKKSHTWETNANGINVMESVQFVINGRPKAQFGIINRDVAVKLVENYESFGYDVKLYSCDAAWKTDRVFMKAIFETMDAKYNNAPNYAKTC